MPYLYLAFILGSFSILFGQNIPQEILDEVRKKFSDEFSQEKPENDKLVEPNEMAEEFVEYPSLPETTFFLEYNFSGKDLSPEEMKGKAQILMEELRQTGKDNFHAKRKLTQWMVHDEHSLRTLLENSRQDNKNLRDALSLHLKFLQYPELKKYWEVFSALEIIQGSEVPSEPFEFQGRKIFWRRLCPLLLQHLQEKRVPEQRLSFFRTAAVFGYFAFLKDDLENAQKFCQLAEEIISPKRNLTYLFVSNLYSLYKSESSYAAYQGLSLLELRNRQKRIYLLSEKENDHVTLNLYQKMIEANQNWREPSAESFLRLSDKDQALYWIHHLQYLAASPKKDDLEQKVDIFTGKWIGNRLGQKWQGQDNPAQHLLNMGTKAIPVLLQHIDDLRPTRVLSSRIFFQPTTYELLNYGDCCLRILITIAGKDFTSRKEVQAYFGEK